MPKPINKTWGTCRCRVSGCDAAADIRRAKSHERGARYLVCPVHGVDRAHGAGPQGALDEWIDANQFQDGAEAAPEPGPEPIPEQAAPPLELATVQPMPEPDPEPTRRRARPGRALFDWVGKAHQEFIGW